MRWCVLTAATQKRRREGERERERERERISRERVIEKERGSGAGGSHVQGRGLLCPLKPPRRRGHRQWTKRHGAGHAREGRSHTIQNKHTGKTKIIRERVKKEETNTKKEASR